MGSKQLQVKTWHLRKMDWEQTNGKQNTKHLRKISFLLGAPFFPVIGSHKEGFFHASTCHLLRVPITGVFFQTYALPHAPSTRCFRAGPFFNLLRSLRLPRRVGFPSTTCPSKTWRCQMRLPHSHQGCFLRNLRPATCACQRFHAVVFLTFQVAASGLQNQTEINIYHMIYGFYTGLWFYGFMMFHVFNWVASFLRAVKSSQR